MFKQVKTKDVLLVLKSLIKKEWTKLLAQKMHFKKPISKLLPQKMYFKTTIIKIFFTNASVNTVKGKTGIDTLLGFYCY